MIAGSLISFNRPISDGDVITYSFSGLNNKSIIENKRHYEKYEIYNDGFSCSKFVDYIVQG